MLSQASIPGSTKLLSIEPAQVNCGLSTFLVRLRVTIRSVLVIIIVLIGMSPKVCAMCMPSARIVVELEVKSCHAAPTFFQNYQESYKSKTKVSSDFFDFELAHIKDLEKNVKGIILEGRSKRVIEYRKQLGKPNAVSKGNKVDASERRISNPDNNIFVLQELQSCEQIGTILYIEYLTMCCDVIIYKNFPCGIDQIYKVYGQAEFDLLWSQAES